MLTAAAWGGVIMNREEPKKKKVISNQLVGRHKKSNIKNSPYGPNDTRHHLGTLATSSLMLALALAGIEVSAASRGQPWVIG